MGCDSYGVMMRHGKGWAEGNIKFSEADDDWGCLCTFPYNYEPDKRIDNDTIRSLAMLGAMVVLSHHGRTDGDSYQYIPQDVPPWITDAICAALPVNADELEG